MSESKDERRASIPGVIGAAITIAGFALLYSSQRLQLSLSEQVVYAGIIGVSAILLFVWIWFPLVRNGYGKWRRNHIARRHFPQLLIFAERLEKFADQRMITSLPNFLGQLKGQVKEFSFIPIQVTSHSQRLTEALGRGIRIQRRNFESFLWAADSLDSLIRFYCEIYVTAPAKEVNAIIKNLRETEPPPDVPVVPEGIREGYNSARGMFVRFLQDYELFISQVSGELGKYRVKILNDWQEFHYLRESHFDPPPELPAPLETF